MVVNWGSVAWWTVVLLSFPFSAYASVFLIGDFDVYKKFTIAWNGGKFDTAGLHIFNNLRAWQVSSLSIAVCEFEIPEARRGLLQRVRERVRVPIDRMRSNLGSFT